MGVIDSGFGGWNSLMGSDLPPSSRLQYRDFTGWGVNPSEVHGTACGEVIYDVAPGVTMILAQVATEVVIANAASWLRSQGADVVSMSLGWLSWGPGDGTGVVSDAVDGFVSAGGVWVNSAGNSRLAHWQGQWRDDDGDGFLNFDSSFEINYVTSAGTEYQWIPADSEVFASLAWNQWDSPATDLDLYLYRATGSESPVEVARAEETQNGGAGQRPVEDLVFTTTEDGYYGFAIFRYDGPTSVDIEFFNRFDANPLAYNVQHGSVLPPGGTAGAITVAALDVGSFALEAYSSRGPTNGPGGALTGGRTKPDLSSFANVSTTSYGPRSQGGFPGTSCACPHVAGAAALTWSGYPSYSGVQIRSSLETNAIDIGPSGMDNDYGHGRVLLGLPPASGGRTTNRSGSASARPPSTRRTRWSASCRALQS